MNLKLYFTWVFILSCILLIVVNVAHFLSGKELVITNIILFTLMFWIGLFTVRIDNKSKKE